MKDKFFIKNKRGDVPIMILVIGVIAICFLTIVSFSLVVFTLNNTFYGIDTMEKMNSIIEEYFFYKNLNYGHNEIENLFEEKVTEYGENYFYLEETGSSIGDANKIVFSVKYYPQ